MSRAHFTALLAMLALGTAEPRLAAQDTSAASPSRPDTSAYTGAGGVDTSARPGRVGAVDTTQPQGALGDSGAAQPTDTTRAAQETSRISRHRYHRMHPASDSAAGASGASGAADTTGASSDTSGMSGRHADKTRPGDGQPGNADSTAAGSAADSTR